MFGGRGVKRYFWGVSSVMVSLTAMSAALTPETTSAVQQRIEQERQALFAQPLTVKSHDRLPTDPALKAEQQRIESERKRVFSIKEYSGSTFPDIPTPKRDDDWNFEALASRYQKKAWNQFREELLVFVSFTMPPESLKRLIHQTHQAGGSVLLRGFKEGSLKATANAIQALGEAGGHVMIHPKAFTQYHVTSVPTVVLTTADPLSTTTSEGCALPDSFASITGDVSLDRALDEIARHSPSFAPRAQRYRRLVKGS